MIDDGTIHDELKELRRAFEGVEVIFKTRYLQILVRL